MIAIKICGFCKDEKCLLLEKIREFIRERVEKMGEIDTKEGAQVFFSDEVADDGLGQGIFIYVDNLYKILRVRKKKVMRKLAKLVTEPFFKNYPSSFIQTSVRLGSKEVFYFWDPRKLRR